MSKRPFIVGIPCDHRMVGHHPFHMVGEKYITAVRDGAGALPLLIPVLPDSIPSSEILASVDGLFFTGSPSNVSPKRYNGMAPREGVMQDENRDATTLPLLEGDRFLVGRAVSGSEAVETLDKVNALSAPTANAGL